jgi:hypothetical protein
MASINPLRHLFRCLRRGFVCSNHRFFEILHHWDIVGTETVLSRIPRVKIVVLNGGVGLNPHPLKPPPHRGFGLMNVTDRLRLHYGEDHTFSIREVAQGRVEVTIVLPLQFGSNPQRNDQAMEQDDSLDVRK